MARQGFSETRIQPVAQVYGITGLFAPIGKYYA
jgi:hypothetical protein